MTNPTTPLPVQEPAGAVEDAEHDTFNVWFEQYRMQTWLSAGCDKDRGPVPSAAWALGSRSSLLRGWMARSALASLQPVTQAKSEAVAWQWRMNVGDPWVEFLWDRRSLDGFKKHGLEVRALYAAPQEAVAHVAPTLLAAFRTMEADGAKSIIDQRFRMVFTFPNIGALHRADDEWMALTGSLSERSSSGSSSGARSSSASLDISQDRFDAASNGSPSSCSMAAATDATQGAVERQPLTVFLDEEMAGLLRQTIGDDGDPSAIRFEVGDGHSGWGLYVSLAEYPEEGAIQLAPIGPATQEKPE